MTTRSVSNYRQRCGRLGVAASLFLLASACGTLGSTATPDQPRFYSLDNPRAVAPAPPQPLPEGAPTLLVSNTRAAAGFDSRHIIYVRQMHKLDYFVHSEWIDTPARMLSPLIVAAVTDSGVFRAVVPAPSSATGELRLDTEVVQLQHEFAQAPSRVRFVLRATLVEDTSRRVIASSEFEAVADAASEDSYGGVVAANQAVRAVLEKLAAFCSAAAGRWRPDAGTAEIKGGKPSPQARSTTN